MTTSLEYERAWMIVYEKLGRAPYPPLIEAISAALEIAREEGRQEALGIIAGCVDLIEGWAYGPMFIRAGVQWPVGECRAPALIKAKAFLREHSPNGDKTPVPHPTTPEDEEKLMSEATKRAARLSTKLAQMSNPAAIQVLIEHEQAAAGEEGRQEERKRCAAILRRVVESAKLLASEMTDPGVEALASIYEAERYLEHAPNGDKTPVSHPTTPED